MHFSSLLSMALLASAVKCAPIKEDNNQFDPIAFQAAGLLPSTSTSTTTPANCNFPSNDFWYLPFQYNSRPACIGIDTMNESAGPWSSKEYNDLFSAMAEQVTKDGMFKSSQVGCWVAAWTKWTTAVPDRDGYKNAFQWAVQNGGGLRDAAFQKFFFELDGQYSTVERLSNC